MPKWYGLQGLIIIIIIHLLLHVMFDGQLGPNTVL
jgi:hypothetical protein